MLDFDNMPINDVVKLAKEDHRGAYRYILKKYKGVIRGRTKKYFLQGGNHDDLLQEGMIGLYKAIRDFKEESGNFDVFSKICIERQLISAIKSSTRLKHAPLNDMISFDRTLPDNDNLTMMDIFGAREDVQFGIDFESLNPEEQIILKETYEAQKELLDQQLSPKEKAIYDLYLEGKSYKEITEERNISNPKMIDNAIQRAKKKIERIKESMHEQLEQKN